MRLPIRLMFLFALLSPVVAAASDSHSDAVAPLLLSLALVFVGAKLGGEVAIRLGQPSVLGELAMGVLLGNVARSTHWIGDLSADPTIDMLSRLGVVVLLFEVGLESTVQQMLSVGARATWVAFVGVVVPIAGGFLAGELAMPQEHWVKHLFLGAAMCATSVGITARVLQDLGASKTKEARIILGAAVVDDVMGLIVLTLVSGVAFSVSSGQALSFADPARVVGLSILFLGGAIALGPRLSKVVFATTKRLKSQDLLLPVSLAFAFGLAALANAVELAPIVGAFAAGLVLEEAHYKPLVDRGEEELEHLIHPVGQFLIPIFFIVMGARVDVKSFLDPAVWLVAGILIGVALVSKLACGLASGPGTDRVVIGIGMVPRGEVGLIFADAGLRLQINGAPLLSAGDYSAIVLMVLVTTLTTPPLLGWALRRSGLPLTVTT